jgi:hypothetical protein
VLPQHCKAAQSRLYHNDRFERLNTRSSSAHDGQFLLSLIQFGRSICDPESPLSTCFSSVDLRRTPAGVREAFARLAKPLEKLPPAMAVVTVSGSFNVKLYYCSVIIASTMLDPPSQPSTGPRE